MCQFRALTMIKRKKRQSSKSNKTLIRSANNRNYSPYHLLKKLKGRNNKNYYIKKSKHYLMCCRNRMNQSQMIINQCKMRKCSNSTNNKNNHMLNPKLKTIIRTKKLIMKRWVLNQILLKVRKSKVINKILILFNKDQIQKQKEKP